MRRINIAESLVRHLYDDGKTQAEIATMLGCSKSTVGNWMRAWGMATRSQRDYTWIDLPRDDLYRLYVEQGQTLESVAAHVGCSSTTVLRRLRDYNIQSHPAAVSPQRCVPDAVFETWTPKLAYVVGLITSDGWLPQGEAHNAVSFSSTDTELINLFCRLLQLASETRPYCKLPQGQKLVHQVTVTDWRFRAFLEGVGLTPAKSKTLGPLNIPDVVFPDFVRGCMDGDGCWTIDHSRPPQEHLIAQLTSGSPTFLAWVHATVNRLTGLHGGVSGKRLRYCWGAAVQLGMWLYYAPDVPALSRKREIWHKFAPDALS